MKNRMKEKSRHKHVKSIMIIVFFFIAAAGAGFVLSHIGTKNAEGTGIKEVCGDTELTIDEKTEKILASMSEAEKVGQLVMIGVQGTSMNNDIAYMLQEFHIGNVILFDRNMESLEQVKTLNSQLQEKSRFGLPLFIAIDEEGGSVARMKDKLSPPPSQREVAMTGDYDYAKSLAMQTADNLKNIGFNLNFAPVADVGNDSAKRMYSDDPAMVTRFVEAAVQGYQAENMLCSLKHFPGIGKGNADSHEGIVNVSVSREVLDNEDLQPFKYMVNNVDNNSYMIMVTHATYPVLDASQPASLSSLIMAKLLRDDLGYKGIIVTDDLDMGAISKYYDYGDVGVAAIKAGADMVMVCHEYEHEIAVYNGILQAVQDGDIGKERLDDSVRRVIKAKLLHLM